MRKHVEPDLPSLRYGHTRKRNRTELIVLVGILFLIFAIGTGVTVQALYWPALNDFVPYFASAGRSPVHGTKILETVPPAQATGPLRVSPRNPRYFTDASGRAIYLTGSHTWDNGQDLGTQPFHYEGYLTLLQEYNHNFIRYWVWEQPKGLTTWPDPADPLATLTPEIYARTGPGTAADGGPKFNVTQFNQAYFDRLRNRVIEAGNRGIYVSVMLFDGWSIEQKAGGANPWIYHPYNRDNNVNDINGDPNDDQSGAETHTLQISAVTQAQEAYVRKVIDTVNDLDNVLYEISNESHGSATEWQYHMINFVKEYESAKPKQHPVGMTVEWPDGNNDELFASLADWVSPNGYADPPPADGSKVVIADTDHIWGIGGDREWAWKSFTRGVNVIYMDPWNGTFIPVEADPDLRRNMGYVLAYANRVNLAAMEPHSEMCSTGYCLANPVPAGAEYLIYLPAGSTATSLLQTIGIDKEPSLYLFPDSTAEVDLAATVGELQIEWFNPETGEVTNGGTVAGGAVQSFTAPFAGDAVLYLYQEQGPPPDQPYKLFLPVIGQGEVSAVPPGPYGFGRQRQLNGNTCYGLGV